MSEEIQWSKITKIELHNFMSHKNTELTFDDSNILDLCGYNDSGKTAVEYALDVLLYDGSPTLQSSYIKEGEDYFNVALHFEDGVIISKTKDNTGKSIWSMSKDGVVIYTNKKDTNIIATDGVPQEIAKYLGVVYDEVTEQKLNLRTKRDKALLTDTTGGENYKMLSAICNSEILSDASSAMTEKRNKLNQEINTKATTLTAYHNQFITIDAPSDKLLDDLHGHIEKTKEMKNKLDMIDSIKQLSDVLADGIIYDEVQPVDCTRIKKLDEIISLNGVLSTPIPPELAMFDYSRLQLISTCKEMHEKLEAACITPELTGVNSTRLKDIISVVQGYNEYNKLYLEYSNVEQQYKDVTQQLRQLCTENNVRICDNCGSAVLDEGVKHEHV